MTTAAKFANDPSSPAAARRFVARLLAHCPPSVREPAVLLVSELATNAVRHARRGFSVSVEEGPGAVRIAVRDDGGGRPVVGAPTATDLSGRGLLIVKTLSEDFGIETEENETLVWFTLSTTKDTAWLQSSNAE